MAAEKQLARQDTDFAINPGNNNETSIKITNDILSLFYDVLPSETTKKNVTFYIYKEDFIKSACGIISSLPLLDKHGKTIAFKYDFCNQLLSHINEFFGDDMSKEYSCELLYNTDRSSCFQRFDSDFNIRNYTVEAWSTISFTKKADGIHMRLFFSKSNEPVKDDTSTDKLEIQQIYYGAPGTGKSFSIDKETEKMPKDSVFRTTFHPDSDYSTFVGAYKPTTIEVPKQFTFGDKLKTFTDGDGNPITEQKVVYGFVKQSFLKAYIKAWQNISEKVALVIEEINRGNCAQIFGDLFQLLDRKNIYSDYPIDADEDLRKTLKTEFAKLAKPSASDINEINALYAKHYTNAIDKIWNGEILVLPKNLHIWATMNTSDQSLFPIDSAFKRRWKWKYIKISDAGKMWQIKFENEIIKDENGNEEIFTQDWWAFLQKVNSIINNITDSADKQLGYFFCQADHGIIDAEMFVSKVIFYLWSDVFKDYGFDDPKLFGYKTENSEETKMLSFPDFYDDYGTVNEHIAAQFIKNVMSWKTSNNKE